MARGGARPGAGRPRGRRSDKTLKRLEAIDTSGLSPLEYMLSVLKDEKQPMPIRLDAAKAAAPYMHPRLANVELGGKDGGPIPIVISSTDAEL